MAKNFDPDCKVYFTECVCWVKTHTGVYGEWGNGGRGLSDNSDPVVGAVLIFRQIHVGYITGVEVDTITYTDRNYDYMGTIRHNVKIRVDDPSIWKIHKF